jgi:hypothetical protein
MPEEVSVNFAGTEIKGCHPVKPTADSRLFEITWDNYVAYSVTNESYGTRNESEEFSGGYARGFIVSHTFSTTSHEQRWRARNTPGHYTTSSWSASATSLT